MSLPIACIAKKRSQLDTSYEKTLERFLAIQAMGSDNARVEARRLKKAITQYPSPASKALHGGLDILAKSDLRSELERIPVPTLRLYGKQDSLVPVAAADAIQQLHLQSEKVILSSAAHGPFISHPEQTANLCLLYTSPSPRDQRGSRMPSSA